MANNVQSLFFSMFGTHPNNGRVENLMSLMPMVAGMMIEETPFSSGLITLGGHD